MIAIVASLALLSAGARTTGCCLVYVDARDGNVWRSDLQGTHRELIVRCKAIGKRSVSLEATAPSATQRGALHLTSVPSPEGFMVIDAARAGSFARVPTRDIWSGAKPLTYSDTFKPSGWSMSLETKSFALEPRHVHEGVAAVRLQQGTDLKIYRFAVPRANSKDGLITLVSPGIAVLQDGASVVLWDLKSGGRTTVATATSAIVWPRDLAKPDRFRPIAKAYVRSGSAPAGITPGGYRWAVSGPDDFRVLPKYLVRRL